jgi:hypothetical protein
MIGMSIEIIEDITRMAGLLSLLAAYGIGRGGGWKRARQRLARITLLGPRRRDAPSGRRSSSRQGPAKGGKRAEPGLRIGVAALWATLLLSIAAYSAFQGDARLADVDIMAVVVATK